MQRHHIVVDLAAELNTIINSHMDGIGAIWAGNDPPRCMAVIGSGGAPGSTGAAGASGSASSPKFRPKIKVPPKLTRELEKFTACMRVHGVTNYPEPEGAGFNIGNLHLDTKSAQYKAAEKKCEPIPQAAFS
jgi:hypothetical protein